MNIRAAEYSSLLQDSCSQPVKQDGEHTPQAMWLPFARVCHHPANIGTTYQRSVESLEEVNCLVRHEVDSYLGLYLETIQAMYQAESRTVSERDLGLAVYVVHVMQWNHSLVTYRMIRRSIPTHQYTDCQEYHNKDDNKRGREEQHRPPILHGVPPRFRRTCIARYRRSNAHTYNPYNRMKQSRPRRQQNLS